MAAMKIVLFILTLKEKYESNRIFELGRLSLLFNGRHN
jgi:hypothetical protein